MLVRRQKKNLCFSVQGHPTTSLTVKENISETLVPVVEKKTKNIKDSLDSELVETEANVINK